MQKDVSGVNLIAKVFDHHRDNVEVVEAACDLIEAIMSHGKSYCKL